MAVVQNPNGETIGFVSSISSETKSREVERVKINFISKVVHDLRSPLAAIKQTVGMILDGTFGEINKDVEKFVTGVRRNVERLLNLVNDILDFSKITTGNMTLNLEPLSIEKTISEVVTTFTHWAESKKIKHKKEITPELPQVEADEARLVQIITNIISNALKFTPEEGSITLKAHPHSTEKNKIQIDISDTGIGIPKEDADKIFLKFYQVKSDQPHKEKVKGTGLGLSIVQQMVKLHKGKIWVESEVGKGTTFSFTLPVISKQKNSILKNKIDK
jgi:signal transduction histidine kinase